MIWMGPVENRKMCKIIEDFVKEEREEGWKEGWKEGWQEGWIEGKIEIEKEVALRMLKAGKNSIEEIAELVGLSMEELRKLRTE